MKRAGVVIGANYGDEGKGLVTDWIASQSECNIVVRFNGGAQAGHTVVTPEGFRHVFSHFGSGSFCGLPTYLSEFFVCNPILFFKELDALSAKVKEAPVVFASPECVVTTFADMMINQILETKRGLARHGSTGVGVNETLRRSEITELKITMADLWNGAHKLEDKLWHICTGYAQWRTDGVGLGAKDTIDSMIHRFIEGCERFADYVPPLGIAACTSPLFEGAQGLLLDQDNKEGWPHVTPSNTGMKNVRILCNKLGIAEHEIDKYYVSRTYMTRHGAGPLENETGRTFEDKTNLPHDFQGNLRFGKLDYAQLRARCARDAGSEDYRLVFTHCDQLPAPGEACFYSHGETRNDITKTRKGEQP